MDFHVNGRLVDDLPVAVPNAGVFDLIRSYDWVKLKFTDPIDVNKVEIELIFKTFVRIRQTFSGD